MVISKKKKKKKRSSPKFGLLFLAVPHHHLSKFPDFAQIFHIAARKTMVLPKYFLLTARKILILPKSSKLGGAIAPPASPAGTAMKISKLYSCFLFLPVIALSKIIFFINCICNKKVFKNYMFLQVKKRQLFLEFKLIYICSCSGKFFHYYSVFCYI